jgi:SAM-dependent methyltransferase
MDQAEFDRFADEYRNLHASNIQISGEGPEFFAEYKIRDVADIVGGLNQQLVDLRVMDFGAGVGNSIPYFKKYLPECELTCLDVSQKSLSLAEERFPNMANFVSFNGSQIPFPEASFDVVFSACVFHHIPHVEHLSLCREIHRVLKPGGKVVIFEHNPLNPLTVRAVNTCAFDENAVLIPASQLLKTISDAGFTAPHRCYRIFFPGRLRMLRKFEQYLRWLALGAQYYVAASKI